jgi:hypothetical protein
MFWPALHDLGVQTLLPLPSLERKKNVESELNGTGDGQTKDSQDLTTRIEGPGIGPSGDCAESKGNRDEFHGRFLS